MSKLTAKSIIMINGKEIPVTHTFQDIATTLGKHPTGYVRFTEIDLKFNSTREVLINTRHVEWVRDLTWISHP